MELNRENHDDDSVTYLDLGLEIVDRQITSNLYDKRNAYNCSVVRFPYRSSSIPSKVSKFFFG